MIGLVRALILQGRSLVSRRQEPVFLSAFDVEPGPVYSVGDRVRIVSSPYPHRVGSRATVVDLVRYRDTGEVGAYGLSFDGASDPFAPDGRGWCYFTHEIRPA